MKHTDSVRKRIKELRAHYVDRNINQEEYIEAAFDEILEGMYKIERDSIK